MDPRFTLLPEFDTAAQGEHVFDYSNLLTREPSAVPAGKPPADKPKATPRATTGATPVGRADTAKPPRKQAA
jgi:hypothetical protein